MTAQRSARAPHSLPATADLMAGHNEIEIDHGGATYRLRLTSLGKLLLTK